MIIIIIIILLLLILILLLLGQLALAPKQMKLNEYGIVILIVIELKVIHL